MLPIPPMKEHLLVVDDEAMVCNVLRDYLSLSGYRVTTTTQPGAAVGMVQQDPPQVVILDLLMPEIDGLTILKTVKESHRDVLVIILTGVGYEDEIMREALELGADGYLSKGLSLSHLVAEIHRVLRKRALSRN